MSDSQEFLAPTGTGVPAVTGPQYLVPLRFVERELNYQMKALQGAGKPLQRARMSNLVIFCNSLETSIAINEQVPAISAVHPARVILLVGEPTGDREVTARVTVRPLGPGASPHTCSEMVTLHAAGPHVERLPFAVRALLIGDLPVNLWWAVPVPPPLAGSLLDELAESAQQIIYDSLDWAEPARGMLATAAWLQSIERPGVRWRVASDLNWRRLRHWRRILEQSLFDANVPEAATSVSEILIEHGPKAVIQSWLLAAWLARQMGYRVQHGEIRPGVEMLWRFVGKNNQTTLFRIRRIPEALPLIRQVCVKGTLHGQPVDFCVAGESSQRLEVVLQGMADAARRTLAIPTSQAVELIGRQLSDRVRDREFTDSMQMARQMAQNLTTR